MRILALDPGGTTGMCVYLSGDIYHDQLDAESIWYRLAVQRNAELFHALLVEKYRPVRTSEPGPAEINGAARLVAMIDGAFFCAYEPAQAKSLAPNRVLARLGWHRPDLPHASDAARLIVCYALLHCPAETDEQRELVDRVRNAKMAGSEAA
jgi:hypothetical protein